MTRIRSAGLQGRHGWLAQRHIGEHHSRSYRLRHGIAHLHLAGRSEIAVHELQRFPTWLERFELPAVEAVATLSADVVATGGKGSDARIRSWDAWLTQNAALLSRAPDPVAGREMVLQTAMEHAEDSPVTASAESWLAEEGDDTWYLRRVVRPETWDRPTWTDLWAGDSIADGPSVVPLAEGLLAALRKDGRVAVLKVRPRRDWTSEHSDTVAIAGISEGRFASLRRGGEVLLWSAPYAMPVPIALLDGVVFNLFAAGNGLVVTGERLWYITLDGVLTELTGGDFGVVPQVAAVSASRVVGWGGSRIAAWDLGTGALVWETGSEQPEICGVVVLSQDRLLVVSRQPEDSCSDDEDVWSSGSLVVLASSDGCVVERRRIEARPDLAVAKPDGGCWLASRDNRDNVSLTGLTVALDDDGEPHKRDLPVTRLAVLSSGTPVGFCEGSNHPWVGALELAGHGIAACGLATWRTTLVTWDNGGVLRIWPDEAHLEGLPSDIPEDACAGVNAARIRAFLPPKFLTLTDDLAALGPARLDTHEAGCTLNLPTTHGTAEIRWWDLAPAAIAVLNPNGSIGVKSNCSGTIRELTLQLYRGVSAVSVEEACERKAQIAISEDVLVHRLIADRVALRDVISYVNDPHIRFVLSSLTPRDQSVMELRFGVDRHGLDWILAEGEWRARAASQESAEDAGDDGVRQWLQRLEERGRGELDELRAIWADVRGATQDAHILRERALRRLSSLWSPGCKELDLVRSLARLLSRAVMEAFQLGRVDDGLDRLTQWVDLLLDARVSVRVLEEGWGFRDPFVRWIERVLDTLERLDVWRHPAATSASRDAALKALRAIRGRERPAALPRAPRDIWEEAALRPRPTAHKEEFNITRARIRQIEAKALRPLRNPSRSARLASFFERSIIEPGEPDVSAIESDNN